MEYASLREKIAADSAGRKVRNEGFKAAYDKAAEAAREAGNKTAPVPMIVTQHANPLDDRSAVVGQWQANSGACGFAWVKVTPGNSAFARWLVKNKLARAGYYGGVQINIMGFGQSVERKTAAANAMAEVLRAELGVTAYADSRED